MAKKSKTQRAKASEARQQRKAARELEELSPKEEIVKAEEAPEKKKSVAKYFLSKEPTGKPSKAEDKPKKKRFKFLHDVKAEMKRVTWPTRSDVIRWSGVVVVALIFFGAFVALLDNAIITPLLFLISGIGA